MKLFAKDNRQVRVARYVIYRQLILSPRDHLFTFVGAFAGIGLIGYLQSLYITQQENIFLIGSFGASAVLVYGAPNSPLAQPRNLIGGHLISAFIGVLVAMIFSDPAIQWFTSALAVASSIVAMQITRTMHPPGGATALIATIGGTHIKALGFMYILSPVLTGVLILLGIYWCLKKLVTKK